MRLDRAEGFSAWSSPAPTWLKEAPSMRGALGRFFPQDLYALLQMLREPTVVLDASLWESFPQALERRTGARRYVGAFRAPFQDLRLAPSQEHALRVCSLLAIPPPPRDPKALPGGCPKICRRTIYRPGRIPCRTSQLR